MVIYLNTWLDAKQASAHQQKTWTTIMRIAGQMTQDLARLTLGKFLSHQVMHIYRTQFISDAHETEEEEEREPRDLQTSKILNKYSCTNCYKNDFALCNTSKSLQTSQLGDLKKGTRKQWPNSRKPKNYYIQGSDRHLQKANDQLTLAANTNWSQRPWAHTIAWTCCLAFTNKHLCFESWLLMTIWNKSIHLNLGRRTLNQQIIALAQGRRYRTHTFRFRYLLSCLNFVWCADFIGRQTSTSINLKQQRKTMHTAFTSMI